MNCVQCGQPVTERDLYCRLCGTRIEEPGASAEEETDREVEEEEEETGREEEEEEEETGREVEEDETIRSEEVNSYEKTAPVSSKPGGLGRNLLLLATAVFIVIMWMNKYTESENVSVKESFWKFRDTIELQLSSQGSLERKYQRAARQMKAENYENAARAYEELGSYSDSEELLYQAKFNISKRHFSAKEYTKAIDVLKELQDHREAVTFLKKVNSAYGIDQYKEGKFHHANLLLSRAANDELSRKYVKYTQMMIEFSGVWENEDRTERVLFYQWWARVEKEGSAKPNYVRLSLKNGNLSGEGFTFEIKNKELIVKHAAFKTRKFKKTEDIAYEMMTS